MAAWMVVLQLTQSWALTMWIFANEFNNFSQKLSEQDKKCYQNSNFICTTQGISNHGLETACASRLGKMNKTVK